MFSFLSFFFFNPFFFFFFFFFSKKVTISWSLDHTKFCSNFTSMWAKLLSNHVWRDFRLRMLALATVARQIYCKKWVSDRAFYVTNWWLVKFEGNRIVRTREWLNVVPIALVRDSRIQKTYPWTFATTSNPLRRDDEEKSVKFSVLHTVIHSMHSMKISRGLSFFISII